MNIKSSCSYSFTLNKVDIKNDVLLFGILVPLVIDAILFLSRSVNPTKKQPYLQIITVYLSLSYCIIA
jgi:hypothetical protein